MIFKVNNYRVCKWKVIFVKWFKGKKLKKVDTLKNVVVIVDKRNFKIFLQAEFLENNEKRIGKKRKYSIDKEVKFKTSCIRHPSIFLFPTGEIK